jgi:hypothetical protein
MNEVGTEQVNAQRQEAIMRLRQSFEQSQQQAGFTEQEKLQQKTQEFEHGEEQTKLKYGAAAAGAQRQFEAGQQTEKLTSEEKRTHETVQGRENAALIRASAASGPRGGSGKPEWEAKPVNAAPAKNPDGSPNYAAPATQIMGLFNNRTGMAYNPQGNRIYAWDNDNMRNLRDPKSTNNNVKPGEVEDLLRDPLGTIPDGPNQGLRKADVFEQAHGYLPRPFISAATQAAQQKQQGSGFNNVNLIGGGTAQVPQANGPQAPEPVEAEAPEAQ